MSITVTLFIHSPLLRLANKSGRHLLSNLPPCLKGLQEVSNKKLRSLPKCMVWSCPSSITQNQFVWFFFYSPTPTSWIFALHLASSASQWHQILNSSGKGHSVSNEQRSEDARSPPAQAVFKLSSLQMVPLARHSA